MPRSACLDGERSKQDSPALSRLLPTSEAPIPPQASPPRGPKLLWKPPVLRNHSWGQENTGLGWGWAPSAARNVNLGWAAAGPRCAKRDWGAPLAWPEPALNTHKAFSPGVIAALDF